MSAIYDPYAIAPRKKKSTVRKSLCWMPHFLGRNTYTSQSTTSASNGFICARRRCCPCQFLEHQMFVEKDGCQISEDACN